MREAAVSDPHQNAQSPVVVWGVKEAYLPNPARYDNASFRLCGINPGGKSGNATKVVHPPQ